MIVEMFMSDVFDV